MTAKKRVIYRINISPAGKWDEKDENSIWNIYQKFFDNVEKDIFTPRVERYSNSVGADLITISELDHDATEIEGRTSFYRAANCMKFYALRDAHERGYNEFLLLDNDILISKNSQDIFENTEKDGLYMSPTPVLKKGLVDIAQKHYSFNLTQTWNGGVILAKGESFKILAENLPCSMYDFFNAITWSKGYPFKVGVKKHHNLFPEGYASSDEIVFPFLASKSKIEIETLHNKWNKMVNVNDPDSIFKSLKNKNFLHFVSDSKKLLLNKDFSEKILLKF